jgi:hydrogenase-4 membrane subunit HyfE
MKGDQVAGTLVGHFLLLELPFVVGVGVDAVDAVADVVVVAVVVG